MSKSVLVIDTPDNCRSCNFFGGSYHSRYCCVNRRYIEDSSKRSCWCPLKPLPEKVGRLEEFTYWNGRLGVWNSFFEEIAGEVV